MTETNNQDICQRLEEMATQIGVLKDCYVMLHNYLIKPGNFDAHLKSALGNVYNIANLIKQCSFEAKKHLDASEFSQLLQEMRNFQIYVGNRFKEFGQKLDKIESRDFQKVRIQIECDSPSESKEGVLAVVPKKRGRPKKTGKRLGK
jgi:hypothetical protein